MRKYLGFPLVLFTVLWALPAFANEGAPAGSVSHDRPATAASDAGDVNKSRPRPNPMDKNDDGVVSREEFMAVQGERFDRMDKNHEGKISPDGGPQRRQHSDRERGEGSSSMREHMHDRLHERMSDEQGVVRDDDDKSTLVPPAEERND